MATLTIRKISDKVWKHTPSDGLAYIVSRLYIKSSGDKIRVVEFNGAIRSEYNYSDIVIYNIGGSAETGFTSSQEVLERLEDLGYIGFFNEGGGAPFIPSDYDLNEFTNSGVDKFAKISDIPIQSVNAGTNITIDNTDPENPIINATGGTSKRGYFTEWKLGGAMAASTSWYAQGALSGLNGAFTANASLTPSNAFANQSVQSPAYSIPFNAKIKSITVKGWTNGNTSATIRLCVVRSNISVLAGGTIQNSAIIGDVSFALNDPFANAFHKQFTSTGLTATTQNAETETRIFLFNNNQALPLQDTIISVEFEEVI